MKSPIVRRIVLGPAVLAEGKARHRGVRPVVGDQCHHAHAWTALRAREPGIEKPAVGGVE